MSPSLTANCTFIRPTTPSARARSRVCVSSSAMIAGVERVGRQRAGAVAGMDAGLLDVLHDAGDEGVACRRRGVDVDLDGVGEVAVDQQRALSTRRARTAGRAWPKSGCSGRARRRRGRSPWRGRPARRTGGSPRDSRCSSATAARLGRGAGDAVLAAAAGSRRSSSAWKRSRSSARSMASGVVPRIGMPASSQRVRRASAASGRRTGR